MTPSARPGPRRAAVALAVTLAAVLGAALPAAAAPSAPRQASCDGDLVTASIGAASLPGGGWSVTDACVGARDFFTGRVEDRFPFAVGISVVRYDDGHTGRLAFLVLEHGVGTLTVVGMEDAATGTFRWAASIEPARVTAGGAEVSGLGASFPPLEVAAVELSFADTAAPWPDWATPSDAPATTVPAPPDDQAPTEGSDGASPGAAAVEPPVTTVVPTAPTTTVPAAPAAAAPEPAPAAAAPTSTVPAAPAPRLGPIVGG